jgi:DNA mismatch repair protein MutL
VATIQKLPDILASQVAAGEVVERPASVVKELVENSIDAGAAEVLVEIRRGGAAMIRVSDNGSGMTREDAVLSLERHATSKLRDVNGLRQILTLGFRGEAVPSIASVSRFRMKTRTAEDVAGTEIEVEGGMMQPPRDAGCPVGTVIEVRDLFFNVPARRKFLKAETTESAHIEHQLRLHALAASAVRFRFRKDEREVFDMPGGMTRLDRLRDLLGTTLGRELIPLAPSRAPGIGLEGFVLPGLHARKGRRHQCVFLNGRPVEDQAISRGLIEGFRGALADGLHPSAWLWIEMNPEWVDVNVHPAKREVRLRRPHELREAVAEAVMAGIGEASRPKIPARPSHLDHEIRRTQPTEIPPNPQARPPVPLPASGVRPVWRPVAVDQALPLPAAENSFPLKPSRPDFREIGTLLGRFALLESADGLVVLDPRAARERILYERWLRSGDGRIHVQPLLMPIVLQPGPREVDLMLRHRELFAAAGFELDEFGGGTIRISAAPDFVKAEDAGRLLVEVVDDLAEGASSSHRFAHEKLAKVLARRAALMEAPRPEEAMALLDSLFDCELPYCGADGRPTLTEISRSEMERRFGINPGQ